MASDNPTKGPKRKADAPLLAWHGDPALQQATVAEMAAWPERFLTAPLPGADLSLVQWQFLAFIVEEALSRKEAQSVREACQPALDVVRMKARGEEVSASAAESAESAAWSAARSAARSAAWSAAWSAARSARSAAESAAWKRYAGKLVELMAAAPVSATEAA